MVLVGRTTSNTVCALLSKGWGWSGSSGKGDEWEGGNMMMTPNGVHAMPTTKEPELEPNGYIVPP